MAGPTFEVKGGKVTHRYLMKKPKWDVATLAMDYLRESERNRAKRREYFARYVLVKMEAYPSKARDKALDLINAGQFYDAAEIIRGAFPWQSSGAGFAYWSDLYSEMRVEGNYA